MKILQNNSIMTQIKHSNFWKYKFLTALVISVILYVIVCTNIYFMQEKYLFQQYTMPINEELSYQENFEEMFFETEKDVKIHGLLFPKENATGLVIINRGSGGSLKNYSPTGSFLYDSLNYSVFIYDYRGNGKSKGEIQGKEDLYRDLRYIYHFFADQYGEKNIILYGNSFGSGIAAKIASENHPLLLILKSSYYTYNDVLERKTFWAPLKLIIRYQFETWKYLRDYYGDALIFHGENDKGIPLRKTEKIKPFLKDNQKFIVVKNASHQNIKKFPIYNQTIKNWYHEKK